MYFISVQCDMVNKITLINVLRYFKQFCFRSGKQADAFRIFAHIIEREIKEGRGMSLHNERTGKGFSRFVKYRQKDGMACRVKG